MARRRNRAARVRRQTRRRRLARMFYRLFSLVLVVVAGVMALTIFFKVETVYIDGETRYTSADLIDTIGVEQGDNLFFWGKTGALGRLFAAYPYLDEVQVRRKLPDTLVFLVKECVPVAVLADGTNGFYIVDKNGKLLEYITQQSEDSALPVIYGLSAAEHLPGQVLADETGGQLDVLLTALAESGCMEDVQYIDVTRWYDIRIGLQGRLDVQLGTTENVSRKLDMLLYVVDNKLSPSDIGEIDLSGEPKIWFRPTTAEEIESIAPGETQPQTEPDGDEETLQEPDVQE